MRNKTDTNRRRHLLHWLASRILLILCFAGLLLTGVAQPAKERIDWPSFIGSSDLIFDTLTTSWTDGMFTGNGLLGNTVFMKDKNTLRVDIGRTDVRDHRNEGDLGPLFNQARLPIGYFTLAPVGKVLEVNGRLDVFNATATGELRTDKGSIRWRSWTQADQEVIVFQLSVSPGEKAALFSFHPAVAESPRLNFHPQLRSQYPENPQPQQGKEGKMQYAQQPLLAGGGYTTLWQEVLSAGTKRGASTRTYYISISQDQTSLAVSRTQAGAAVAAAVKTGAMALWQTHTNWWHQYYKKSFISLPDPVLNSFYWIQLYKLASASRKDKPIIDLMGPWMAATPWPGNWWNLNTELTYSPLFAANHLGIASVLGKTISRNAQNLSKNVPAAFQYNSAALGRAGGPDMLAPVKVTGDSSDLRQSVADMELGDLTWNLYYYWLQYRYSMDTTVLASLYPILKKNINYYLHLAKIGADGYLHLPYSYSPEYPAGLTRDANYALSLFRWGCQTLLEADSILGRQDSLAAKWRQVLKQLTPYPSDENGLRIGRDIAFAKSHRHYSHLLMIYPLHLMTWQNLQQRPLIEKSLRHWHSLPGALQGYSFTGGASIYALMGQGDQALDYLKTLIYRFVKPNTMYMESGPVIETPLAAAASIQELLLQSWGGVIRVFPAAPSQWADISFRDMRTEGAFLISALRNRGKTRWVRIVATHDGLCKVQPGLDSSRPVLLKAVSGRHQQQDLVKTEHSRPGYQRETTYQIQLRKGDELLLYTDEHDLAMPLEPVVFSGDQPLHFFGKKKSSEVRN